RALAGSQALRHDRTGMSRNHPPLPGFPATFVAVKVKHTDFRPARRPRYVPSGRPRRKFPLIRILLLIALGLFVYSRLDTLWAVASESLRPATVWHKVTGAIFGGDESSG